MGDEYQVPWIRSGTGATPSDGGCIMQVIDWIDRNEWTDSPECVHEVFRSLAIYINDEATDEERQQLLDLAPRLMGTNTGDDALTRKLLGWLARQVYPAYEAWAETSGYDDRGSVLACIEATEKGAAGAAEAAEAAWGSDAARAARAARAGGAIPTSYDLLVGCLDEYDRLTGREAQADVIDWSPVCDVMEVAR